MTRMKAILTCMLIAVLSSCGKPSPAKPPNAEMDLPEALRRSIVDYEGKKYYKIHIDSDKVARISGRIVSQDELKTLRNHGYDPEVGIYLAVYGLQDSEIVNRIFESLESGGVHTITRQVAEQESEIMRKRE